MAPTWAVPGLFAIVSKQNISTMSLYREDFISDSLNHAFKHIRFFQRTAYVCLSLSLSELTPPWISCQDLVTILAKMLQRTCYGTHNAMVRSYQNIHVSKKNLIRKLKMARKTAQ